MANLKSQTLPAPCSLLPAKPNLRPSEIAEFLDISLATVYVMLDPEQPALPWIQVRGQKRIPRAAFLEWYTSQLKNCQLSLSF